MTLRIADRARLRFARGTDGQIMRAGSAATEGSNARFWWLTSFTLRDDHVESTSRRTAARSASTRSVAFFFGAPHPFLWARPKKWGGKRFYKGLPLFRPAAIYGRAMPTGAAWASGRGGQLKKPPFGGFNSQSWRAFFSTQMPSGYGPVCTLITLLMCRTGISSLCRPSESSRSCTRLRNATASSRSYP